MKTKIGDQFRELENLDLVDLLRAALMVALRDKKPLAAYFLEMAWLEAERNLQLE